MTIKRLKIKQNQLTNHITVTRLNISDKSRVVINKYTFVIQTFKMGWKYWSKEKISVLYFGILKKLIMNLADTELDDIHTYWLGFLGKYWKPDQGVVLLELLVETLV